MTDEAAEVYLTEFDERANRIEQPLLMTWSVLVFAFLLAVVFTNVVDSVDAAPSWLIAAEIVRGVGLWIWTIFWIANLLICSVPFAIAARLPAPTPFRERGLLQSRAAWFGRSLWAAALLIVSGAVGGLIAQGLDTVAEGYLSRFSTSPQTADQSQRNRAQLDAVESGISLLGNWLAWAIFLVCGVTLVVIIVTALKVLLAGRAARFNAAVGLLIPYAAPVSAPRRLAVAVVISRWYFPIFAIVVVTLFALYLGAYTFGFVGALLFPDPEASSS